eukprot:1657814-Amphidinium_carterae.1
MLIGGIILNGWLLDSLIDSDYLCLREQYWYGRPTVLSLKDYGLLAVVRHLADHYVFILSLLSGRTCLVLVPADRSATFFSSSILDMCQERSAYRAL